MTDKFTIGFSWLADIYCYECGKVLPKIDPEGNEKHPIATWQNYELADFNCAKCHAPIENW